MAGEYALPALLGGDGLGWYDAATGMSNWLRCWFLVLAAVMLSGKLAEIRPHVHASTFYCPTCMVATSRRKILDRGESVFGYAAQSGGDPQKLAFVEFEAVVTVVSPTSAPVALAPSGAKLLPWRSPPPVDRVHSPDIPRGPPTLA